MRLPALLLALALAACAAPQPQDGLPRVYVDGARVIAGHKHDDAILHLDACEGCGLAFRQAVDQRLNEIVQAQRQRQAQPAASVAPPSSPSPTKEAPK